MSAKEKSISPPLDQYPFDWLKAETANKVQKLKTVIKCFIEFEIFIKKLNIELFNKFIFLLTKILCFIKLTHKIIKKSQNQYGESRICFILLFSE
jgi:hypothetical protein